MVQDYKCLHPSKLEAGAGYHYPGLTPLQTVGVDSPAIDVMTDLRLVAAATIDGDVSIDAANQAMIARGVRSLLVVDGQGSVVGIITSRDIHGERPMQVVHKRGVRHGEVKVGDVMTRREDIEVLDLSEILRARVGAVIETLKRSGRQHALVADRDKGDRQMVRGIFSLSQIARQLGLSPMHTTEVARTFAEIEAAISEVPAA